MPKGWGLHRAPQLRTSWLPALHPGSASPRPGLQHSHPPAGWWAPLCPRPGGQEPRGAFLFRGCHGPALHAATLDSCGQTRWQPAINLSALPHQALTPRWISTPASGPISCFLPHPPWTVSFPLPGLHPSTPSPSLAQVPAGLDERLRERTVAQRQKGSPRPHPMLT